MRIVTFGTRKLVNFGKSLNMRLVRIRAFTVSSNSSYIIILLLDGHTTLVCPCHGSAAWLSCLESFPMWTNEKRAGLH